MTTSTDDVIRALASGAIEPDEAFASLGELSALAALAPSLKSEQPIGSLERLEALVKLILRRACAEDVTGPDARAVAAFQREVGFLLKYKPYAVKCASPLGYSIFLQRPGQGFSFQRHVTHKVEVFHVLEVAPGGFVFVCDHDTWVRDYEPEAFAAWLAGASNPRYEVHRYRPEPGDVVAIEDLNVVHTVVGCTLEEFATVSTDMVDRLHDQNAGAEPPSFFSREYVRARLPDIAFPAQSRAVSAFTAAHDRVTVPDAEIEGGTVRVLADSFVSARTYTVRPGGATAFLGDAERIASVYVASGRGQVAIAGDEEGSTGAVEPTAATAGDLLTILPRANYRVTNLGDAPLVFSEHRIAPELAFSDSAEHYV